MEQLRDHAISEMHPLCVVCTRSLPLLEIQTCSACVGAARRDLAEIVELYALLPETLGHPASQRLGVAAGSGDDESPVPGGDALVMLAGGSGGRSQIRGVLLPNGERSDEHEEDEWETDAPSVAFELSRWEDDWRLVRQEPAAEGAATVAAAVRYLGGLRLSWAGAHHEAFDEFASDLRRLVSRLRTAAGTAERPVTGVECLNCEGVALQRRYRDRKQGHGCLGHWDRCAWPYAPHGCTDSGGLEDDWHCPRCKRPYSEKEYDLAVAQRHAMARKGLVTASVVEDTLGIREDRLRQWASRGKVSRRGTDGRGRTLYALDEVRSHAVAIGVLASESAAVSQ